MLDVEMNRSCCVSPLYSCLGPQWQARFLYHDIVRGSVASSHDMTWLFQL
jgi:hypothetical protein